MGIEEGTLKAIETYYEDAEFITRHVITLWLVKNPDNPVTYLGDALITLEKKDISQKLWCLVSLGKFSTIITCTVFLKCMHELVDFPLLDEAANHPYIYEGEVSIKEEKDFIWKGTVSA